jgi:dTDP-4-amino-4,6-dideoxygalactose transaminase
MGVEFGAGVVVISGKGKILGLGQPPFDPLWPQLQVGDFLPSELNAAYLWAQLEKAEEIQASRMAIWQRYWDEFTPHAEEWGIELPVIPEGCEHNAHMFYIKCRDLAQRTRFIDFMKENKILSVFHYVPLHSAPAGLKYGRFDGEDRYTTAESDRLVRLPIYYNMFPEDLEKVVATVKEFFFRGQ